MKRIIILIFMLSVILAQSAISTKCEICGKTIYKYNGITVQRQTLTDDVITWNMATDDFYSDSDFPNSQHWKELEYKKSVNVCGACQRDYRDKIQSEMDNVFNEILKSLIDINLCNRKQYAEERKFDKIEELERKLHEVQKEICILKGE